MRGQSRMGPHAPDIPPRRRLRLPKLAAQSQILCASITSSRSVTLAGSAASPRAAELPDRRCSQTSGRQLTRPAALASIHAALRWLATPQLRFKTSNGSARCEEQPLACPGHRRARPSSDRHRLLLAPPPLAPLAKAKPAGRKPASKSVPCPLKAGRTLQRLPPAALASPQLSRGAALQGMDVA